MQRLHYAAAALATGRCVYSPDGSTFLREMTSWPPSLKCDVKSKIRLRYSLRLCLKNKFHPDPIWNDEALETFFKKTSQQKEEEHEQEQQDKWDQFLI